MTNRKLLIYISLMFLLLLPCGIRAFNTDVYTTESRLASGKAVKIAVAEDNLYLITTAQLRQWGFNDASKVRIYGYGGHRQADILSLANYTDDLPPVQYALTSRGLVFYGLGGGQWVQHSSGTWYYRQNDYSNYGYYFLKEATEDEDVPVLSATAEAGAGIDPATTFTERVHHELERVGVPGEAGPLLLGEDFLYTPSRSFSLLTPDALEGSASIISSFVCVIPQGTGKLAFNVGQTSLTPNTSDNLSTCGTSKYVHGTENVSQHSFKLTPSDLGTTNITISFTPHSTCSGAWLNYVCLNYLRRLTLPATGVLEFNIEATELKLAGSSDGTRIWDVTTPTNVLEVSFAKNGSDASWTASEPGIRRYVAWSDNATLPSPTFAGVVAAQNLHGHSDVDMVIVAPAAYAEHAERLAQLHRDSEDALNVLVVEPEQIYNEFSSGTIDPGGLRRYFKMLYDRGNSGQGRPLRYAVLMGRTTNDNRGLTALAPSYPTLPSWMPWEHRASLSDNEGYCSDDVTAMLEDGSGANMRYDKLSIAIGRIPVTDTEEARSIVDKALQYAQGARKTAWKHRYMFLADDEDNGIHLQQAESLISKFENYDRQQHMVRKVYLDAYPLAGSSYPQAREAMYRYLDEGVVWWSFIGHANTTSWTADNILSYTDLRQLYLRHWPFIYAATCDFLRLDGTNITGGEILYKERYGGAIGIISAVRPVYISDNGMLSNAMGRALAQRDDDGRLLTPGEIYRRAKNDIRDKDNNPVGDTNRLRYVFIGDPALRLAMPSNIVHMDKINGTTVDAHNQPTIAALSQATIEGSVTDPDGALLDGFNGVVMLEIFDAEQTRTTLASKDKSSEENFEDYGDRIYVGSAKVVNGKFSCTVAMPAEISQNFRPAAISMYAYSEQDDTEAVGLCRDFYVFGFDETVAPDTEAPVIEQFVLNHSSFRNGDTVCDSPMIIARVSDNIGINVSSAGIGHQMTATLDGKTTYNDLSLYYTPDADGSAAGVLNYPLENLREGEHTLSLRVWDTAGNCETAYIDFSVRQGLAPVIFDVYTDANPASTVANFYISHDQPDVMATVTVTVYNLLGQPLWSGAVSGRSDMFNTVPLTWNLCDNSGRRVPRGIYLYRASITTDNEKFETASRKIAVTAQ